MKVIYKGRGGSFLAYGEYTDGKIMILKGSTISNKQMGNFKFSEGVAELRKPGGKNAIVDSTGMVVKDYLFSSASTAAQFVSGNSTNGLRAWKTEDGKSLGDTVGHNKRRNNKES